MAKNLYWTCKDQHVSTVIKDQLLRASSSVTLNIAEGSGKMTPNDQAKFYSIALGSLREVQAILELEKMHDPKLKNLINQLKDILFSLTQKPSKTRKKM